MYLLYRLATGVALLILSPYFAWQAFRRSKYVGSLRQRLGMLPRSLNPEGQGSIWVQAVSVGEVLAIRPLIAGLRAQHPDTRIFLSTTTSTGQQLARRSVPDVDGVFYFPFDWAGPVRRALDRVRPALFLMAETEIWPIVLRECRRRGVRTAVINGRISPRSFRRYRLVRPLFRRVLAQVDRFCVQGDETARRLVSLGADPSAIVVTGNLKFDALNPRAGHRGVQDGHLHVFGMSTSRPVVVAGSTMKGEDGAVIEAFISARATPGGSGALLVLAPRHPERFDEAEGLCTAAGLATVRRTAMPLDAPPQADIVILDTIGELAQVYEIATVVFVGGSLVPTGGHNILEPAVHGKPVLFGPHMHNFREMADMFLGGGAAIQVRTGAELAEVLASLLNDPARRERLGAAARALVDLHRGATGRTLAALADLLPGRERRGVGRPFRMVQ